MRILQTIVCVSLGILVLAACGPSNPTEPTGCVPSDCDLDRARIRCPDGTQIESVTCEERDGLCETVSHECPEIIACRATTECPAQMFCDLSDGGCGSTGFCRLPPRICGGAESFVCGCDGQNYEGSCVAENAGVAVDHGGRCRGTRSGEPGAICDDQMPCNAGHFCDYATILNLDVGNFDGTQGVCRRR